MSYNVANFDQTVHSDGARGTVQLSDGNLGFEGANGVTINSLGDITANAFFGFTTGGGGGGGPTPTLQAVTVQGATTNRAVTISNSLSVSGNLFVTGNLVSVDVENLVVQDPIIQLANSSTSDTADTGIVFTRPTSNVVVGWRGNEDEVMVGFSTSSASGTDLVPLNDNKLNMKVYGNVEATNYVKGDATHLSNLTDATTGTYGSSTQSAVVQVDGTGRITGISESSIDYSSAFQDIDDVLFQGNTTSRILTIGGVTVTGTETLLGDANGLSNIVNSDVTPGTYGSGTQVPRIVISSDHRITSITTVPNTGGDVGSLQDVTDTGNTTSNTIQFTNTDVSLTASGNVQVQGYYLGNANLLSNIVNSDVGPATYGNATHVTQITITDSGRISGVSNVEIQERSNLDQVVNRGNVSSNIVTFGGIVSTGNIEATDFLFDSTTSVLTIDSGNGGYIARSLQYIKFTEAVSKGHPIYISGVEGDHLLGGKADETDSTKMPAIGLSSADYSTNDFGYVVRLGEIYSVSESAVFTGTTPTANKTVYVGSSGNLTVDRPTGSLDLIQNIGIISKVTGNSVNILVQGAGRANDIPNRIIANDANIHQTVTIGGGSLRTDTNLYVTGNVYADQYEGDANLLSNIVNSDVGPATYGNTTHVTQITISDTGRITGVSNVEIQELSNLDQVVNRGNVTSNTVQFTNTETSLITSGNVYINGANPYASLNVRNPTTSNVIYVQSQTTSNALISFVNTQTFVESGNEYPSLGCSGNDLVFYPGVPRDLAVTISANKNMTVVGNVEVHGLYLGNANLLSNIVNSDVGPATYGNTTHVTQITITDTGRISAVSNVEIQERSNLEQVVNRGNVTSNSVQIQGNLTTANIYVSQSVGAGPTVSSNIITVDQAGHSYKFFRVPAYPTGQLEGITIQNPTDGCQTLVDIHPISGDLDVFQNFSNGGTGPTVLTSLNSNLVINTGNHVMISCVTDLSNTFVNIIGFY